jgi:deoxyhypusine synthase
MQPLDLTRVQPIPLQSRQNKVVLERFARPPEPGRSFAGFVESLPQILAGEDLRMVVEAIVTAHRKGRPVILGMGAHVIKCGLSPVIIDLMRRGVVTALALNGGGAIHDFEIALVGGTSEEVTAGLRDGTFGMARETGELMNHAIDRALDHPDLGMGATLADRLIEIEAPCREYSLLVAGRRLGIPVTVHTAIGTDVIHMHPSANGRAIGQATFTDFRIFAAVVAELSEGVYLNVGSAVVLPEVFLKAFTIAQNLGANLHDFVTVDMDMIVHYRPGENVVRRPRLAGGRGYTLVGRHEFMIPLLAQAVVDSLEEK